MMMMFVIVFDCDMFDIFLLNYNYTGFFVAFLYIIDYFSDDHRDLQSMAIMVHCIGTISMMVIFTLAVTYGSKTDYSGDLNNIIVSTVPVTWFSRQTIC